MIQCYEEGVDKISCCFRQQMRVDIVVRKKQSFSPFNNFANKIHFLEFYFAGIKQQFKVREFARRPQTLNTICTGTPTFRPYNMLRFWGDSQIQPKSTAVWATRFCFLSKTLKNVGNLTNWNYQHVVGEQDLKTKEKLLMNGFAYVEREMIFVRRQYNQRMSELDREKKSTN